MTRKQRLLKLARDRTYTPDPETPVLRLPWAGLRWKVAA